MLLVKETKEIVIEYINKGVKENRITLIKIPDSRYLLSFI